MRRLDTATDLIEYFQMAVKVEGWSNPEDSPSYHAAKVLRRQRDVISEVAMRNRVASQLLARVLDPAWKEGRPEYERDRDVVLGWALRLIDSDWNSEYVEFLLKLANEWLDGPAEAQPIPAEWAYKRSRGER